VGGEKIEERESGGEGEKKRRERGIVNDMWDP
jgi:hypothetical protein